jgi:tRNA threonylcarbamoyladenosine biosynthesis protein TsaB
MEVYTAVFTPEGRQLTETKPIVVDAGSFAAELAEGPVLFIGDGALKCREVLTSPNAFFADAFPSALAMAPLAEAAWNEKRFEDVAYFEPFYLKDFVATVSRKKLF